MVLKHELQQLLLYVTVTAFPVPTKCFAGIVILWSFDLILETYSE